MVRAQLFHDAACVLSHSPWCRSADPRAKTCTAVDVHMRGQLNDHSEYAQLGVPVSGSLGMRVSPLLLFTLGADHRILGSLMKQVVTNRIAVASNGPARFGSEMTCLRSVRVQSPRVLMIPWLLTA